jgi:hypothetical protein
MAASYDAIYQAFITGDVAKALQLKQKADSVYGSHYWTPPLLFLEAAAYLKQRKDSLAQQSLQWLIQRFPESPLKPRAAHLLKTISQRDSLEQYLSALNIKRVPDDTLLVIPTDQRTRPDSTAKTVVVPKVTKPVKTIEPKDTAVKIPVAVTTNQSSLPVSGYTWIDSTTFHVVMVMEQVDLVYAREAKLAFDQYNRSASPSTTVTKDTLGGPRSLLVFSKFTSSQKAARYYENLRKNLNVLVGWMKPSQYSFLMISSDNLIMLQKNKTLDDYRNLLRSKYPTLF